MPAAKAINLVFFVILRAGYSWQFGFTIASPHFLHGDLEQVEMPTLRLAGDSPDRSYGPRLGRLRIRSADALVRATDGRRKRRASRFYFLPLRNQADEGVRSP